MEVCFGTHPDNEPTQLESPDMKESFAAGLQSQSCLCVQGRFSFFMTSAGEEATAVGSAAALTLEDTVSQKLCLLKQHLSKTQKLPSHSTPKAAAVVVVT